MHVPIVHDLVLRVLLVLDVLVDDVPGDNEVPQFLVATLEHDALVKEELLGSVGQQVE